jgi:hypothetical protein
MKKLTDIKALELNIDETQKKFDANWKLLGKEGQVNLKAFYEWQEEILKPLTIHSDLKRWRTPFGLEKLRAYENTKEYKFAVEFSKLDWEPIYIDVGQQVRELRQMVELLLKN